MAKPIRKELFEFDVILVDAIRQKLRKVPSEEIEQQYGSECLVDFIAKILDC